MGRNQNIYYWVWCGGCSTLWPDQTGCGHGLLVFMLLLLRGTRCRRCCCGRRWRLLLARLWRSWQLRSWRLLRIWRLCMVLVLPKLRLVLLVLPKLRLLRPGQLVVLLLLLLPKLRLLMWRRWWRHRRRGRRRPGLQPPPGHRPTAISSPGLLGC